MWQFVTGGRSENKSRTDNAGGSSSDMSLQTVVARAKSPGPASLVSRHSLDAASADSDISGPLGHMVRSRRAGTSVLVPSNSDSGGDDDDDNHLVSSAEAGLVSMKERESHGYLTSAAELSESSIDLRRAAQRVAAHRNNEDRVPEGEPSNHGSSSASSTVVPGDEPHDFAAQLDRVPAGSAGDSVSLDRMYAVGRGRRRGGGLYTPTASTGSDMSLPTAKATAAFSLPRASELHRTLVKEGDAPALGGGEADGDESDMFAQPRSLFDNTAVSRKYLSSDSTATATDSVYRSTTGAGTNINMSMSEAMGGNARARSEVLSKMMMRASASKANATGDTGSGSVLASMSLGEAAMAPIPPTMPASAPAPASAPRASTDADAVLASMSGNDIAGVVEPTTVRADGSAHSMSLEVAAAGAEFRPDIGAIEYGVPSYLDRRTGASLAETPITLHDTTRMVQVNVPGATTDTVQRVATMYQQYLDRVDRMRASPEYAWLQVVASKAQMDMEELITVPSPIDGEPLGPDAARDVALQFIRSVDVSGAEQRKPAQFQRALGGGTEFFEPELLPQVHGANVSTKVDAMLQIPRYRDDAEQLLHYNHVAQIVKELSRYHLTGVQYLSASVRGAALMMEARVREMVEGQYTLRNLMVDSVTGTRFAELVGLSLLESKSMSMNRYTPVVTNPRIKQDQMVMLLFFRDHIAWDGHSRHFYEAGSVLGDLEDRRASARHRSYGEQLGIRSKRKYGHMSGGPSSAQVRAARRQKRIHMQRRIQMKTIGRFP